MLLRRLEFTDVSTIGELTIDDFKCWTLEDTARENTFKIPGKTAIPAGRYRVIISYSTRFKRDLPLLLDVPNFEGVRIHPGNTDQQTEGCILPGYSKEKDWIGDSRRACEDLQKIIEERIKTEQLWLTITGGREA